MPAVIGWLCDETLIMAFVPTRGRRPVRGAFGIRSRHLALLATALALCGLPSGLRALPQAADPASPTPRTKYRPVIENYVPFRPVEPRSWKGVNEEVAPKPKPTPENGQKR
jgi:hypothetical protein